jgi:DNA-binding response OmpR family regulator
LRLHEEIVRELARNPTPREAVLGRTNGPLLALLVEDDLVSAALVEGYLAEAGFEVVAVGDGGDALLELGSRHFDLIVLDINVPTLSGLKVFEIMLQKQVDTPALFVTGVAGLDVEMQSLEMGAAGFLRKPVRKEVLLRKIRGILQRKPRTPAANE